MKKQHFTLVLQYYRLTKDDPKNFLKKGDIIQFKQMAHHDQDYYNWVVNIWRPGEKAGETDNFHHYMSTEWMRATYGGPGENLEKAMDWLENYFGKMEEINVNTCGEIALFGKREEMDAAMADLNATLKEAFNTYRKNHPDVVLSERFDFNWVG